MMTAHSIARISSCVTIRGTNITSYVFPCDEDLAIHDIEHWLKDILVSKGKKAPGKLSFASPERMMRYLGLEPGSVSPFGLINDTDHHVILFLDSRLKDAPSLSFHPNDCRGTIVIEQSAFRQFLNSVGNTVEYMQVTMESSSR